MLYDENTLCLQDSFKWLLSGIELNMHKTFAFTCFLRAKRALCFVQRSFTQDSGIGLFHRRYASSLRFTCIYSLESGRFAFGEGALTREIPCSLGSF